MNKNEIRYMFNKIARDYDFLNNLISFFTHKIIKKQAVELLNIKNGSKVLDICTGSGDLASVIKKNYPDCVVTGIDFSEDMLKIAKEKHPSVKFLNIDVCNLKFDDNTFDYIVSGFGFRNIINKNKALSEVSRVLSPCGKFLHLDFGEKNLISKFASFLILFMAKIFSKNFSAYKYLVKSKEEFLLPDDLITMVECHQFKLLKRKDFLFKVITCEVFEK